MLGGSEAGDSEEVPRTGRRSWLGSRTASKRVREQAEPLLRRGGEFVVHPTLVAGEYVMSVRDSTAQHITLRRDLNGLYSLEGKTFASMAALVQHYVQSGEALTINGR